jgi:protein CpxP
MNRLGYWALGSVLLTSIPAIYANDFSMGPTEMVDARLDKLTHKLDLNAAQQQKARAILLDEANQMEPLHQQMKSIHDASDVKLNEILNPDQQKKYVDLKAEHRKEMEKKLKK